MNRLDAVVHLPAWAVAFAGVIMIVEAIVIVAAVTAFLRLSIEVEDAARRAAQRAIAGRPPIAVPGREVGHG